MRDSSLAIDDYKMSKYDRLTVNKSIQAKRKQEKFLDDMVCPL